ncbi:MAG TPA: sialidase family protein, partial [Puia sp.]|nr:sialidase family protein [Puia sp.]
MRAIIFHTLLFLFICSGCKHSESSSAYKSIIAAGHAPSMVQDRHGRLHIAYCEGDSIMYVYSSTGGKTFSAPALVSLLPGLASSHARGPQIAVSGQQLTIIAGNKSGNIFSFAKKG